MIGKNLPKEIGVNDNINRRRHSNGDIEDGSQPFSMEEAI